MGGALGGVGGREALGYRRSGGYVQRPGPATGTVGPIGRPRGVRRMPKIKQLLAEGQARPDVRGRPALHAQADRDRRRARRVRRPLARRRARRARDEGDRARHDGRPVLRARPLRPPAGDRLRLDHAVARGRGRRGDGQHGPRARGRRAGRPLGQVLPPGRARDERRQPRRPVRPDARWPSTSPRPTPRPSSASRSRPPRRSTRWPRSPRSPTSTSSSSARPTSARSWASPATSRTPSASTPSRGSPAPAPRPASPGGSSRGAPSTPSGCAAGAAGCSSSASTSTPSTPASAPPRRGTASFFERARLTGRKARPSRDVRFLTGRVPAGRLAADRLADSPIGVRREAPGAIMNEPKTLFITGATGLVGSHAVEEALRRGHPGQGPGPRVERHPMARRPGASRRSPATSKTPTPSAAGVEGADWVFNCAAKVGDWGTLEEFRRLNVEAFRLLLDAATDAEGRAVRPRQLARASTRGATTSGPTRRPRRPPSRSTATPARRSRPRRWP